MDDMHISEYHHSTSARSLAAHDFLVIGVATLKPGICVDDTEDDPVFPFGHEAFCFVVIIAV